MTAYGTRRWGSPLAGAGDKGPAELLRAELAEGVAHPSNTECLYWSLRPCLRITGWKSKAVRSKDADERKWRMHLEIALRALLRGIGSSIPLLFGTAGGQANADVHLLTLRLPQF